MSAGSQKDTFHAVVMNTLGEECDYTVVKNIHDNLNEMIEETKDAPEVPVLTKPEVKRLLAKSGVADEKIEIFDNNFDTIAGEKASFWQRILLRPENSVLKHLMFPSKSIQTAPILWRQNDRWKTMPRH